MFTMPVAFILAFFLPPKLAADQESSEVSLNYPARSEITFSGCATMAYNTTICRFEPAPESFDSKTPKRHVPLNHPLINLPVARPLGSTTGHKPMSQSISGLAHLVGSHISGIVRPVSCVTRLLSLVTYMGLDALRFAPQRDIPQRPPPPLLRRRGMDLAAWEIKLDTITRSQSFKGAMELLVDGDEFFPRLERTVRNARKSVHIQTYIFDNDDYALDFGRLLKEQSSEVEVKVLMDGLGSIMASGVNHKSLPEDYIPPDSLLRYLKENSRVRVRRLTNPWLTFDHTKSMVIDRSVAFVGGMNIGREYRHLWHDIMAVSYTHLRAHET